MNSFARSRPFTRALLALALLQFASRSQSLGTANAPLLPPLTPPSAFGSEPALGTQKPVPLESSFRTRAQANSDAIAYVQPGVAIPRAFHTVTLDPATNTLWLIGGYDGNRHNTVWRMRLASAGT